MHSHFVCGFLAGASSPGKLEKATQAEDRSYRSKKSDTSFKNKLKSPTNQHASDERRKSGEFGELLKTE